MTVKSSRKIQNPSKWAWAASTVAMLLAGCGEGDPPLPQWTAEVQVTDYDWNPLPERIEAKAGHSLDLTLSFKWASEAGMMEDRPIRPPAEWPVAAAVLTEGGDLAVRSPINSPAREFRDVTASIGTERRQSDRSLVWISPNPPENMQSGRRYFWGRVEMPKEPGTYRLVISVYPTIRFATDTNPDYGPAEELYSTVVHVKPATEPPPSIEHGGEKFHPAVRAQLDKQRAQHTRPQ